jgi:hypothetical protein
VKEPPKHAARFRLTKRFPSSALHAQTKTAVPVTVLRCHHQRLTRFSQPRIRLISPLYKYSPPFRSFSTSSRQLRSDFAMVEPVNNRTAHAERLTDNSMERPALDDRSYRVIRLPNKLEALLIHDADTDKASAALDVNVGSFSDKNDMPGLAHAVEHMLFMGTEKVCFIKNMCVIVWQLFLRLEHISTLRAVVGIIQIFVMI